MLLGSEHKEFDLILVQFQQVDVCYGHFEDNNCIIVICFIRLSIPAMIVNDLFRQEYNMIVNDLISVSAIIMLQLNSSDLLTLTLVDHHHNNDI